MPERIQTPSLSGRSLQVEFVRYADRFGHTIQLLEEDVVRPLLTSLEGTVKDRWPPSPVLQQLHVEERGCGKNVALLVGMAGRSHWSMSVESETESASLVFDVACRVHADESVTLQSTYQCLGLKRFDNRKRHFDLNDGWTFVVDVEGQANTTLVAAECNLVISPSENGSATRRWKYRVMLVHRDCQEAGV